MSSSLISLPDMDGDDLLAVIKTYQYQGDNQNA